MAMMVAGTCAITCAAHAAARTDAVDAAVRHLRTAVVSQRDGSHLAMLFSLRQLREPSLKPLFHQLVQHKDWQVQVHAVLGLAELDANERLDPWLVSQIDPTAQEAVIASALDMNLLGVEAMRELIATPTDGPRALPPLPRLMLHAELIGLGESVANDAARLRAFAEHEDLRIAGLASMLLAEMGEPAAFTSYRERYPQRSSVERRLALPWLLDAVRQYELKSAGPWLREMIGATRDEVVVRSIVQTLLTLDAAAHLDVLKQAMGDSAGYRERVHYGFTLLSVGADVPAEAYDLIRNGEALTNAMADAGAAFSRGADAARAFIRLIEIEHPRSREWVMHAARDLPAEQSRKVYLHVLERLKNEGAGAPAADRAATAVTAAARLYELEPDTIIARLRASAEDSLTRQVLLLAMLDSRSPHAGEAAMQVGRSGFGRADSMATLLVAKHAETINPDDLRRLGMIASGGGNISEPLQAQAAWLYLKHAGQIDAALGRMFAQGSR